MNLNKVQDMIIEEFDSIIDNFKNEFSYFRYVASFGKKDTAVEKKEENLVKDTKSKIWLEATYVDGKIYYAGDSDSQVIKGIVSLFVNVFSGRTAREIVEANLYFVNEIKLYNQLSAARLKEIGAVLQKIKTAAVNLKLKHMDTSPAV
ncbi:MAG: SufE family protein [Chitinophagaceae bacterium]|nr:SufE family protein [Chitinophagaceae bacterium]MCW5926029.1 SufE family protein [Chitinophagaceae bacterium]